MSNLLVSSNVLPSNAAATGATAEEGPRMGTLTKPLRTERQAPSLGRLKMHLRVRRFASRTYRLVTLRPGARVGFSTNFFHQTWHILSDQRGAQLLARLLWGLSYQCRPGTLILVHGQHLLPTPFEADRADPFLLVPAHLTSIDPEALRALKARLGSLGPPDETIRWQTFGLDAALAGKGDGSNPVGAERRSLSHPESRHLWRQERMGRCGGLIYYTAPPPVLRQQALGIHNLRVEKGKRSYEMDYFYLAESAGRGSWAADGEVQIFADFHESVSAAVEARRETLAGSRQPMVSPSVQWEIIKRRDSIKRRKKCCLLKGLRWGTVS
jgi:hypothetical protein